MGRRSELPTAPFELESESTADIEAIVRDRSLRRPFNADHRQSLVGATGRKLDSTQTIEEQLFSQNRSRDLED